jgi:hypothetical protein
MKESVITVTLVVLHEDGEDPVQVLDDQMQLCQAVKAIIEPHVEDTQDAEE